MPIALYPGTFDPVHYGHIDIATRASALFDRLIIAIYDSPVNKRVLFPTEERVALMEKAVCHLPNVEVVSYNGLTVHFARQVGAHVIVRGLRTLADFEFEFQLAMTNQKLAPEIDMVTLVTRSEYAYLSASILKEVAGLGGDISEMTPPHVQEALRRRFAELGSPPGRQVPKARLRDQRKPGLELPHTSGGR
ncbi:MAG TPA: pantetheine-phosphate adenylyltransferase [Caldilineae bacterium]|nr:pantetheine-phosphate adenylyltransferase [Caldilineae bacterium]